jgi:hypothetical protein
MTVAELIKRLHYFDHQFLREDDFTDEQNYHLKMRRLHNHLLHTWGIAEGLGLGFASGASRATIGEGMAVDGQGQEIVLAENTQTQDLSGFAGKTVFVTIAYGEQETDPTSETGVTGNRRWTETPVIEVVENPPGDPSQKLILGRVTVGGDAKISSTDDGVEPNRRRSAGVVGGDLEVRSLALTDPGVASTQWPRMRLGAANRADLAGNLRVTGNVEVSGTVDGRDVSADGTKLDAHVAITSGNPHGTTAAQVGAVPLTGGTISGNLSVSNGTVLLGSPSDNHIGIGKPADKKVTVFITGGTSPTVGTAINAAVLIWPILDGFQGLNLIAASGGVDTLSVSGTARFTGTKIGYVADTFVNGSGNVLRTGDVVKLKASGSIRFHGDANRIPIPEVTLTDSESDPLVIGVVAQEATPASDEPDRRTEPEDPTSIPSGGELFVVTLGTFAHCRVDANGAPIEVGDLLTSSANPGHATKATNPKLGSIIGKALEPLKEGTGYIAVFVNIQ